MIMLMIMMMMMMMMMMMLMMTMMLMMMMMLMMFPISGVLWNPTWPTEGVPERLCIQSVWAVSPHLQILTQPGPDEEPKALEAGIERLIVSVAHDDDPVSLDVYALDDGVEAIDVLKLAPWQGLRKHMYVWQPCESPGDGCLRLTNPRLTSPDLGDVGLAHPSVPMVMLLEALIEREWKVGTATSPAQPLKTPHAGKLSTSKLTCRPYLQVCVHWSSLFDKGLLELHHSCSAKYYQ